MCGCICQWGGGEMVWDWNNKAVVKSGLRIPSLRSSPILYVYNRAQMPLIPLMLDDNKRPSGLSLWDLWPWDIFYFYPLHQNNCTLITWGQEGLALQMQDNFFYKRGTEACHWFNTTLFSSWFWKKLYLEFFSCLLRPLPGRSHCCSLLSSPPAPFCAIHRLHLTKNLQGYCNR